MSIVKGTYRLTEGRMCADFNFIRGDVVDYGVPNGAKDIHVMASARQDGTVALVIVYDDSAVTQGAAE